MLTPLDDTLCHQLPTTFDHVWTSDPRWFDRYWFAIYSKDGSVAIQITMGAQGYANLKTQVADKAMAMTLQSVNDARFSRERSGVIHSTLSTRMMAMSNTEFQELLRPAFKEDEWILIMLGAALGTVAGFVQLLVMWSL